MDSFLNLLAKDLVKRHGHDFEHLTILFPNKRAGLFLARELASLIDRPVWMPEILTLSEFIERHIHLKKAEDLPLTIKLYKAYCDCSGSTERFDDFYFWGHMLLGDFDDIDKYLVDARGLFSNLIALKEIESRFPYLTAEQVEVIRHFWSSFHPEKYSREQEEFLNVWTKLYPTYCRFKEGLARDGLCYEGMGQRLFCEHLGDIPAGQQLIFAGFNALNRCEKKIFAHFRDKGQALFYWDYDLYYSTNEHHEAGLYLRENMKLFPNALGIEHFNHFLHNGKHVDIISVPSNVGQAKIIPSLLEGMHPSPREEYTDTAVVLCDEALLTPVLHAIPEHIRKVNITMGYPARNTSVATLVSLLADLQHYAKREGERTYYYYKTVVALLNHKLVRNTYPAEIPSLTNEFNTRNIVYVPEERLQLNDLTSTIFSLSEENPMNYLLRVLAKLITDLPLLDDDNARIEKELLFSVYTSIQGIRNTFEEEGIAPDPKLYLQIIYKILQGLTIPFSGEPLEGMQIMGLMETRMLDFNNLIILSANEGILPRAGHAASFIPYNLRAGFGLPTPEHQDALFAYYFYRLLQRAQHIKITYIDATQGLRVGEMSRFLHQMKYESGLPIKEIHFQNAISVADTPTLSIPKTSEIMTQLARYTSPDERGLSPSALNTYLECRLKFYFRYIARIKEKETMAEELDYRLLGTIFHQSMQSLYRTLPDGQVTTERLNTLIHNDSLITAHVRQAYSTLYDDAVNRLLASGTNELILNVVKKYIKQVLEFDKKLCPFRLMAMEQTFRMPFIVEPETPLTVYIEGDIDRVDLIPRGTRVIDYKTGADRTDFKTISSLFDPENKQRNKAAFQTILYCLLYQHAHPEANPILPGIYSLKLLFAADYEYTFRLDKEPMYNLAPVEDEFKECLTRLLRELYSPDIPFSQTPVTEKCRNCPYSPICKRE